MDSDFRCWLSTTGIFCTVVILERVVQEELLGNVRCEIGLLDRGGVTWFSVGVRQRV